MQDGPALKDGPIARVCTENRLGTLQVCYSGCDSRLYMDFFTDCPWVRLRLCHRKCRRDPCFHHFAVLERFQDRRKQPSLTLHRLQGDTVGV